mmetsp:Transcript_53583/g.152696  ORF Transcript_53583/g.152696 Transcript_53583/m.152696 type:complete len:328 (-) Transcript_53583:164-1147(-)
MRASAASSSSVAACSCTLTASSRLFSSSRAAVPLAAAAARLSAFEASASAATSWTATLLSQSLTERSARARARLALRSASCWSLMSCCKGASCSRKASRRARRPWQSSASASAPRSCSSSCWSWRLSSLDAAPTLKPALAPESFCAVLPKLRQSSPQSLSPRSSPGGSSSLQTPVTKLPCARRLPVNFCRASSSKASALASSASAGTCGSSSMQACTSPPHLVVTARSRLPNAPSADRLAEINSSTWSLDMSSGRSCASLSRISPLRRSTLGLSSLIRPAWPARKSSATASTLFQSSRRAASTERSEVSMLKISLPPQMRPSVPAKG